MHSLPLRTPHRCAGCDRSVSMCGLVWSLSPWGHSGLCSFGNFCEEVTVEASSCSAVTAACVLTASRPRAAPHRPGVSALISGFCFGGIPRTLCWRLSLQLSRLSL